MPVTLPVPNSPLLQYLGLPGSLKLHPMHPSLLCPEGPARVPSYRTCQQHTKTTSMRATFLRMEAWHDEVTLFSKLHDDLLGSQLWLEGVDGTLGLSHKLLGGEGFGISHDDDGGCPDSSKLNSPISPVAR